MLKNLGCSLRHIDYSGLTPAPSVFAGLRDFLPVFLDVCNKFKREG